MKSPKKDLSKCQIKEENEDEADVPRSVDAGIRMDICFRCLYFGPEDSL